MKKYILFLIVLLSPRNSFPQILFTPQIQLDNTSYVRGLEIDSSGNFYFATYYNFFVSTDNGVNWKKTFDLSGSNQSITISTLTVGRNYEVFIGVDYVGIYRSLDTGKTWTNLGLTKEYIGGIVQDDEGTIFAATGNSVFALSVNDSIWQRRGNGIDKYRDFLWALYINQKGIIFAGSECGLYRSTDRGMLWDRVYDFNCGDFVSFAETKNGTMYMGGADRAHGLFRSYDDGTTWTKIFDKEVYSDGITISSEEKLFIHARDGLYLSSTENDTVWVKNSEYDGDIYAIHPNGYLYAGRYPGILLKSTERVDIDKQKKEPEIKPCVYFLEQNFPNPFNPTTSIQYALPYESSVRLTVYNTLGQIIKTFYEGTKASGSYSINFNGQGLSSGVYLYSINAVSVDGKKIYQSVKKMIILK